MNKKRRKELAAAIDALSTIKDDIEAITSDESDARDGLEERFSETERYATMENNVEILETAQNDLENIIESLQEVE